MVADAQKSIPIKVGELYKIVICGALERFYSRAGSESRLRAFDAAVAERRRQEAERVKQEAERLEKESAAEKQQRLKAEQEAKKAEAEAKKKEAERVAKEDEEEAYRRLDQPSNAATLDELMQIVRAERLKDEAEKEKAKEEAKAKAEMDAATAAAAGHAITALRIIAYYNHQLMTFEMTGEKARKLLAKEAKANKEDAEARHADDAAVHVRAVVAAQEAAAAAETAAGAAREQAMVRAAKAAKAVEVAEEQAKKSRQTIDDVQQQFFAVAAAWDELMCAAMDAHNDPTEWGAAESLVPIIACRADPMETDAEASLRGAKSGVKERRSDIAIFGFKHTIMQDAFVAQEISTSGRYTRVPPSAEAPATAAACCWLLLPAAAAC